VFLHVSVCELIASEELESELVQNDGISEHKVLFRVVLVGNGVLMLVLFQEFTSPNTRVSFSLFVNLNGIITTEEGNDECSSVIFFILTNKSGFITKDILVTLGLE